MNDYGNEKPGGIYIASKEEIENSPIFTKEQLEDAKKTVGKYLVKKEKDNVNHPSHYADNCSLECLDAMEIAFGFKAVFYFCICNAFKYIWRYKNKNGIEDIKKARFYVNKARQFSFDIDKVDNIDIVLKKIELKENK